MNLGFCGDVLCESETSNHVSTHLEAWKDRSLTYFPLGRSSCTRFWVQILDIREQGSCMGSRGVEGRSSLCLSDCQLCLAGCDPGTGEKSGGARARQSEAVRASPCGWPTTAPHSTHSTAWRKAKLSLSPSCRRIYWGSGRSGAKIGQQTFLKTF